MVTKRLVALVAVAALTLALAPLPVVADTHKPPASALKGAADEEGNTQGRVPLIRDTDPVFAGNQEGIKAIAEMIRRGYTQKPLLRLYARLYPRLYPFDHPFEPRPAVPVKGAHRPETAPAWSFLGPVNIPGRMTALVRHPIRCEHALRGRRGRRRVEDHGRRGHVGRPLRRAPDPLHRQHRHQPQESQRAVGGDGRGQFRHRQLPGRVPLPHHGRWRQLDDRHPFHGRPARPRR